MSAEEQGAADSSAAAETSSATDDEKRERGLKELKQPDRRRRPQRHRQRRVRRDRQTENPLADVAGRKLPAANSAWGRDVKLSPDPSHSTVPRQHNWLPTKAAGKLEHHEMRHRDVPGMEQCPSSRAGAGRA